jgi:hypothetical protein
MDKKVGIYTQSLFGESSVETLRRYWKDTKLVQTFTHQSMQSMLFKGDRIPHIEPGTLFRIDRGTNSGTLGISTRYGPIMLQPVSRSHVQILMNRTLEAYAVQKRKDLDLNRLGIRNAMVQFLGFKDGFEQFLNLGEIVERDEGSMNQE